VFLIDMWVRKEEDKDLWNLLEIWKLKMDGGVRQNSSHVIQHALEYKVAT